MKTKGNWVIKYEDGFYYCGNNLFDKQLRKAQIYHWKEAAEEQAENLKTRRYSKVADTKWEIVSVIPPQELKDTEAEWQRVDGDPGMDFYVCSNCGISALNDQYGQSVDSLFCPHCGKRMINSTMPED
jgi:DNA-directed RNA polymerase subunit RPC12/RpoP